MAKFLKNTKEFVLLSSSQGKSYITDSEKFIKQSGQKGGTCSIYSCLFAPRFGKNIEILQELFDATGDLEAKELLDLRNIEKIISKYRKEYTLLDLDSRSGSLTSQLDNISIDEADEYIHQLTHLPDGKPEEVQFLVKILTDFQTQNDSDDLHYELYDYLEYIFYKKSIKLHLELLQQLNANSILKKVFENVKEKLHAPADLPIEAFDIKSQDKFYGIAAELATAKAKQLQFTDWNPLDGIDGLMHCIQTHESPLRISGMFGSAYYNAQPTSAGLLEGYDVYYWKPGEYKSEVDMPEDNHSVLIIGAQKNGNNGYVYFIDPKDESIPGVARKIYKISYERLLTSLCTPHGESKKYIGDLKEAIQTKKITGPFAMHVNDNLSHEYAKKYKSALTRLQELKLKNSCDTANPKKTI